MCEFYKTFVLFLEIEIKKASKETKLQEKDLLYENHMVHILGCLIPRTFVHVCNENPKKLEKKKAVKKI